MDPRRAATGEPAVARRRRGRCGGFREGKEPAQRRGGGARLEGGRGGSHGGSRRPPPPRARWPELDSAPPRRARRAAREQEGVGVGRRDVERREGGRRRPGCSAEPRTPRSERESRGIWWRARETERARREISRRHRWGKKSKGSEGRADGPGVTVKFGNLRSPADSSSRAFS